MKWTLKDHGDLLEKQSLVFIETSLPAYQEIWSIFIGHKGNGAMADMKYIPDDIEKKRKEFAQHHYTILESLYFMQLICDEELTKLSEIKDFEQYRKSINQIMAFVGYLGRVIDCMEKCFATISHKNSRSGLMELYRKRNIVLHGKKFPIEFSDGLLESV